MKTAFLTLIIFLGFQSFAQNESLISVSGTATKMINADELIIRTGISLKGKDAEEIFSQANKIMDKAMRFLKSKEKKCSFETDVVRLSSSRDYKTEVINYTAHQSITVKIYDFDSYDAILSELIDLGFNNIQSVTFALSNPEIIKEEVRKMAIQAAKKKAQKTADLLDVNLGGLYSFNEEVGSSYPIRFKGGLLASDVAGGGQISTLAPGQVMFTTTVYVSYSFSNTKHLERKN